jgi:adenylylsulfate kinase
MHMEKPARSLMKAISWRIVATLTTIFLVFVFSKDLTLGTIVGIAELILKTFIYYVHERVWNLSNFGRQRK